MAHQETPGRRSSLAAVQRSRSASLVMSSSGVTKPPPVPRNSLIRSSSNSFVLQDAEWRKTIRKESTTTTTTVIRMENGSNSSRTMDVKVAAAASATAAVLAAGQPAVSRSFAFQSAGGVRQKIPITPVISTRSSSSGSAGVLSRHDTLHYRHGTLVFPSSGVVQGRLTLDMTSAPGGTSSPDEPKEPGARPATLPAEEAHALTKSPSSPPSSPPITLLSNLLHHPLMLASHNHYGLFGGGHSNKQDDSLLQLCQVEGGGDAGSVSRYLSLHSPDRIQRKTANAVDSTGKSALMHAAMTGNLAVVRLLVKVPSVDINLADKEGNTALHFASQAGHADVVGVLTLCPNIQIDSRNDAGLTALMKAALQGRVRCTRLLLLAGASAVLRDFGRGACAAEWARLTGRSKCAEIIEKYMDKMQLNPGLAINNRTGYSANSEPSLLLIGHQSGHHHQRKDSWVKTTLKKAMTYVGAGRRDSIESGGIVASQLTGGSILGSASILALPTDPVISGQQGRRSSLPVLLPPSSEKSPYHSSWASSRRNTIGRQSEDNLSRFVIPRIQVSYWSGNGGPTLSIPPPPTSKAPPIPASIRTSEKRPEAPTRTRSKSATRS